MTATKELESEIKELIVDTLMLEDITADEIESEMPLFVDGVGLDSIDALELGMAISKKYDVKMSKDQKDNMHIFANVKNLTEYVQANRPAKGSDA